jgi:hypothetical protein
MADHLRKDYVRRWAGVVAKQPGYGVETFGRSVAAHLLDAGFSSTHLHLFIKQRLDKSAPEITLAELCEALQEELNAKPLRQFEVLLAFGRPPKVGGGIPATWLDARGVSAWLELNGFSTTDIRPGTGISMAVQGEIRWGL